jgi:predicted nucleotidyltransferase
MLTIDEIKVRLTPIFESNNIQKAIIFGSHALGLASANSDVDLIVDNNGFPLGFSFFKIAGECEEILGTRVDLYEFSEIEPNSTLDYNIKTKGVLIYGS